MKKSLPLRLIGLTLILFLPASISRAVPPGALPFDEETLWTWADSVPKPTEYTTHARFLRAVDESLKEERALFESSFSEYLSLEAQAHAPSYRGLSSEPARLRALGALFRAYLIVASTRARGDWDLSDRHHLPRPVGLKDATVALTPFLLAVGHRLHIHTEHASLPWFGPVAELPQYENLVVEAHLNSIGLAIAGAHLLFYAFSTYRDRERMGEYQRHGRGLYGVGSEGQGGYRRFYLAGFERVRDLYRSLRLRFVDTDRTWEEDFLNSLRSSQSFEVPAESRADARTFRTWLGRTLKISNECEVALDRYLDSRG